jgi:hypothetical protein
MEKKSFPQDESTAEEIATVIKPEGSDEDIQKQEISKGLDITNLPPELAEGVEHLPPEMKKVIKSSFQMMAAGQAPADPELLKQQDNHQFQFGMKGLDVTLADRREARAYDMKKFKVIAGISIFILLSLGILSAIALYTDKTDFIIELIKAAGYIFGGFGTGMIVSKKNHKLL